jgi:hypothetical protein
VIVDALSRALAEEATAAKLAAWLASDDADVQPLAEALETYLKAVPGAMIALTAMTKEPRYGRSVAFVAGQALVYLVDEDDLFDDTELGALGLLDDAYLIHGCIAALRTAFPELDVPDGYAAPIGSTAAAVRSLLPAGVPEALDRTCENLVRVAASLYAGGASSGNGEALPRPALRVGDAVAALSRT